MSINDLTDPTAITRALKEYDSLGSRAFLKKHGFGSAKRYFVSHQGRLYDAKAIAGVAYGLQYPDRPQLGSDDFSGGKTGANVPLQEAGFAMVDSSATSAVEERVWRELVRKHLESTADEAGLNRADEIRAVGAFGNMRGIWVDKTRTVKIDPAGVTVALKHTGLHYADEVTEEGMAYFYPSTGMPGQDQAEVASTKKASELALPVFVVIEVGARRQVRLGWVEGWDDDSRQFYVAFQDQRPEKILDRDRSDEEKFHLDGYRSHRKSASARVRPDQAKFKFQVTQRYKRCPFTGLAVHEMLEAAHLKPDAIGGSSDPRNGLLMSAALHRAFDANLFAINPDTLEVETRPVGRRQKSCRLRTQGSTLTLARMTMP